MNRTQQGALREFHVSREARDLYQFDQSVFAFNGNVIFADFYAARVFAQKMNDRRDLVHYPEQAVRASQIYALGLIDETLHLMVETYRRQVNPKIIQQALAVLEEQVGKEAVDAGLRRFCEKFPPLAVYRGDIDLEAYLAGETGGMSHREVALEELLMLWLANANPAFAPYLELFDDDELEQRTAYPQVIAGMQTFFSGEPGFGPDGENLFDMLQAPARLSPTSLEGQLAFVRGRWAAYVGARLFRVLGGLDFVAEEQKAVFAGPGPIEAISFGGQEAEPEQYSPDTDWMPRLVLLAKNAYVWLDQLSKQYERPLFTLADIPDEELDILAARGITGLWLIGLWERSRASRRIKQMMGNPEAVASAYSLYDYSIAHDLGGVVALDNLRQRAWQRGIRLASDMVPNHMAIDSRWVIEHPDWFLQLNYSPFPAYSFNGVNLNENDARVGVYLEDHYYDRSDAAVVFKRVDHWTGDTRYIYHGNDGTSMPWNDTAQLDYLRAEVREAVIQTILHVARQFPIIRFDAAMTLAKRHIQRLWFPEPGSGGAIASRAEHGLTRGEFDAAMPNEFWREVVDRVAAEAPDTLLLAEAFWLMEGYFVRTLGMHRVYNSAFMHMLRDEDNDKYRQLIKNTVEFDPEILKRYVNFMSNPDEKTAVEQFDKGDKYFGVATVLATVPGLPMFGHGQFEGYTEKYGMEYRRAYYDERPDTWLVERHRKEITPLLKRRYLFAQVHSFLLFDFFTSSGAVDENVLAYSNRAGNERSLVVYHNKFSDTRGWIRTSAAYLDKGSGQLVQKSLSEGLSLPSAPDVYVIFRDLVSGLEYIRSCREVAETGMFIQLGAYQRHVFVDFREVMENESRQYGQVAAYLSGRGVPSVDEAVKELFLQPLHQPYRDLVSGEVFRWLYDHILQELPVSKEESEALAERLDDLAERDMALLREVRSFAADHESADEEGRDIGILKRRLEALAEPLTQETPAPQDGTTAAEAVAGGSPAKVAVDLAGITATLSRELGTALHLPLLEGLHPAQAPVDAGRYAAACAGLVAALGDSKVAWGGLFAYLCNHNLGRATGDEDLAARTRSWMDEWLLGKLSARALVDFGLTVAEADRQVTLIKLLIAHQELLDPAASVPTPSDLLTSLLRNEEVQRFLAVNRFEGVLWYNKESFAELLHGLFAAAVVSRLAANRENVPATVSELYEVVAALWAADSASGYRVETLLELAEHRVETTNGGPQTAASGPKVSRRKKSAKKNAIT